MKKSTLSKVNATMVKQLINFENYKINAIAEMIEFVNNSSIPNKEEVIEEYKQTLENQEEEPNQIVLGGEFNQYVLEYDENTKDIIVKNEIDDTFGFGVNIRDLDFDDYNTLVDIDCSLNEQIEEYFGEQLEDCGEYWEIKE